MAGRRLNTGRGRDAGYPAPPAQTRAGATNAHGSCLGCLAANRSLNCLPHTLQPAWPALPTLRPAQVRLWRVLLGQRPSSTASRGRSPALVRLLRSYYAAVRLPAAVHPGLIAPRVLPAVRVLTTTDVNGVSRFSRVEFLCLPGVFDSAGPRCTCDGAHRCVAFRAA